MTGPLQKLDRTIVFSVIQQGAFLVFGTLMHDGGLVERSVLCSMLAYWVGVAFVLMRRRERVTAWDKFFVRWGFLMLWGLLILVVGVLTAVVPSRI